MVTRHVRNELQTSVACERYDHGARIFTLLLKPPYHGARNSWIDRGNKRSETSYIKVHDMSL